MVETGGGGYLDLAVSATSRTALDSLPAHLATRYGIRVTGTTELDLGVFRVDREDGPPWVARVFPSVRPLDQVEGDARILRALERQGFPAERCAGPEPVSVLDGQPVLVTGFVEGAPAAGGTGRPGKAAAILGAMLGRLHAATAGAAAGSRRGGAWHHLVMSGGPREEIAAVRSLLEESLPLLDSKARSLHTAVSDALGDADDCEGLPEALLHPDFVPANAIITSDGKMVMIDWAGAGRGPRLWTLAFLLWAGGARDLRLVDAVISRYIRHVILEEEELARLAGAVLARPVVFECWRLCVARRGFGGAEERIAEARRLSQAIAARARGAIEFGPA